MRVAFYRLALERGYLDAMIDGWIVRPFVQTFRWCDRMERRWAGWLSGATTREVDRVHSSSIGEELP